MSNECSMDLLEALRNGVDADTLISNFQEQMMDAQMQYAREQEEKQKTEMNLQAIRENLAHDFLDYIVALGIMPGETIGKDEYDFMVKAIKETEGEMKKAADATRMICGLSLLGHLFH